MDAFIGGIAARSERYMRTHWDHAKGLADDKALEAARRDAESAFIRAQQEAGLTLVAPALVSWEDLFRPFVSAWGGITAGALTRYFETNTFYRQPHVTGELRGTPAAAGFLTVFQIPPKTPWVLTLPSPWDFALRSQDDHYGDTAALAHACAVLLAPVVDAAVQAGAAVIRFHDPSAVYPGSPAPDPEDYSRILEAAAGAHREKAVLHLTNGDPFARLDVIEANPFAGLSIEDPGRAPPRPLETRRGTRLTAAVVRGEESLLEDPRTAAAAAARLAEATGLPLVGVTNGWDLDHVPHTIQLAKLEKLSEVRRLLDGKTTKEALA
jgi:methionine synthase II (cobalamin-independent)